MSSDLVKIYITYDTGSASMTHHHLGTADSYAELIDALRDVSQGWIHIKGRIDDVDANDLDAWILRESIKLVECVTINGM